MKNSQFGEDIHLGNYSYQLIVKFYHSLLCASNTNFALITVAGFDWVFRIICKYAVSKTTFDYAVAFVEPFLKLTMLRRLTVVNSFL